jgi:TetR/AcrR family transcriptional regulator, cholesterol catabolism regulator
MSDEATASSQIGRLRRRATSEGSESYLRRRKEIITAAGTVFHAKGLANTSVLDVSEQLGVDRASVYYYFNSKQDLFHAVIYDAIHDVVARVKARADSAGSARDKIIDILTMVVEAYEEHYPALHVYLQEDMRRLHPDPGGDSQANRRAAEQMAALAEEYMSILERLIADGIATGELRDIGSPALIAAIMEGAVNWMHRWFKPSEGPSPGTVAAVLAELLMGGLSTHG